MPDISGRQLIILDPGLTLTVVADASSSGIVRRVGVESQLTGGATNRSAKTALSTQYQRGSIFVAKNAGNAAEFLVGGDFA